MVNAIMQKAWSWLSPKFPDSNVLMSKAMEVAQNDKTPAAVIGVLEQYAHSQGMGGVLQNNQYWQQLKTKRPDEIIPYAKTAASHMGVLGNIMSMFGSGGGNNNGNQA